MKPWGFALMGLPGAGKSTLAAAVAPRIPARIISRDEIRARQFPLVRYSTSEKAQLNAVTFAQAEACLRTGQHVLVDGIPFSRVTERDAFAKIAERCGAVFQAVLLDVPLALAESRVLAGLHPAADRTAACVREVAARFELVGPDAWRLDAQQTVTTLADEWLRLFRACLAA